MADAAAISAASFASSSSNGGGSSSSSSPAEDDLRKQVHATLRSLQKREPLEPTYKKLLQSGSLTRRPAPIFKNKFYRRIPSRLRERVELYSREMEGKDPFDRISQRRPIDQDKLAVSMTLRAAKDHEQAPLLEATLAATAMHPERKRSLDGMALYLQKGMPKKKPRITSNRSTSPLPSVGAVSSGGGAGAEAGHNQAELDRQKEQARQWEEARKRREAEEKQRREDELAEEKRLRQREQERLHEEERMRHAPAPAPQASSGLHKIIDQSFQKLSELRFDYLPGERPFEVVIDRDTCHAIAPDYFSYVSTPMNLLYIKKKKEQMKYTTLHEYFADVDLMIDNALKYNRNEGNLYRKAALELQQMHNRMVKAIWKRVKEKQDQEK